MADADSLRREAEAVLAAAERQARLHLCCKLFGGALCDGQGAPVIPPRWHYHRAPACMRAKLRDNQACIAWDLRTLPAEAGDGPAWRTCPAGRRELIVPMHLDGRLEALLYLSPAGPVGAARARQLEATAHLLAGWLRDLAVRAAEGRAVGGDPRLVRIGAFLDAHLHEDPGLDALAAHLGLSAERTRHLVQEETGRSFRALKERHRLAAAQRLLGLGFQPVKTVARQCGCADAGWFGRWFRRRTGQTPLAWRAANRRRQV
jgi:AraC-like DNA-binding protein